MLKGKTALITGSTAGIGYAAAERLAFEGCNIVLNGIEPAAEIAGKVSSISDRFGVGVYFDGADVGNTHAVEAMVAAAEKQLGGIDIVINNAVTRVFGPIEDTAPADWERAMAVNLTSAFNTIRCTMPGMKARNWGRIINMSSIYGLIGAADRASYVVSKTALIGLTRAIAMETIDYEITCNALCPGSVNTTRSTEVIKTAMASRGVSEEEAIGEFLAGKQPSGRFVAPESVAEFVALLCSPAGGDINGTAIPIDMGWSAT